MHLLFSTLLFLNWTASSEFGTYRLCEQRRFRRACASAQSRQNLRCSLIQAVSQEEPSDRKPDPWPAWMVGHAQLKFVMTECSKTQIRLTGLYFAFPDTTVVKHLLLFLCMKSYQKSLNVIQKHSEVLEKHLKFLVIFIFIVSVFSGCSEIIRVGKDLFYLF